MFIASQVMGLFSLIIYIISFQIDNRNKLLNLQIFANIFAVFQYLLLQAYSGMAMFIIAILGNYLFKKNKSIYSLIYCYI
ncbi:MAG: YgjV family protein [Bacilli bacterium]